MYSQLQNRYPTASLISELLQIQDGNFVVRAVVQVGGVTLTSGMAASPKIEQAEDQARLRALAVLSIYPSTEELQAYAIEDSRGETKSLPAGVPTKAEQDHLDLKVASQQPDWSLAQPSASTSQANLDLLSDTYPAEAATFPGLDLEPNVVGAASRPPESRSFAKSHPSRDGGTAFTPETGQNGKSAFHSRPVSKTETLPQPIDLSDIIAQTSVELKRLGWSNAQGRNHLQQTYGKRSRQQLSDEELLEFLQYLQGQPTADEPFF